MDTKHVNDALDKLFQQERIVFWNDPDKEFVGYLTGRLFSPIDGVKVIRLDQIGTANIRREFFAAIAAGRKKIEYRDWTPFWTKKIEKAGEPHFIFA